MRKTLAKSFCQKHRGPAAWFIPALLRRRPDRPARLLQPLLRLIDADWFAPDREPIRSAGHLTRANGLAAEVAEFNDHPANSGRLRREWQLRLSLTRLRLLVLGTFAARAVGAESIAPLPPPPCPDQC